MPNTSQGNRAQPAGFASIGGGFYLPTRAEVTVTDADSPDVPYLVAFTVELEDGRYVCQSLSCRRRLDTIPPGPPVTSKGIRDLPIARLMGPALRYLADQMRHESGPVDWENEELLWVAQEYRFGYAIGSPPTKYVAEQLGIPSSTAAKKVMRAREAGLLGPTTPGKAGEG